MGTMGDIAWESDAEQIKRALRRRRQIEYMRARVHLVRDAAERARVVAAIADFDRAQNHQNDL